MGSNPILAAIGLRKHCAPVNSTERGSPVCALVSTILLPSGRRPAPHQPGRQRIAPPLTSAPDDLVQVGARSGERFRPGVDIDLDRQRPPLA